MGYCVWVHLRAVTPDEHVAPRKLVLASAPLIFEWMGKCQLAFKEGLNGQNDQRGAKVIFSVGFSRLSGVSVRKWPKAAVCTGCLLYTKGALLTTGILIILFYFKHVITRKLALRSVQLVKKVKDQQIYHIPGNHWWAEVHLFPYTSKDCRLQDSCRQSSPPFNL